MASLTSQIQAIETNLNRLKLRVPDLPVTQLLSSQMLVSLGRELSNMLDQRLRLHGLSEIVFRALMNVYSLQNVPAYPGELCASLGQSPANITRIIDNLVERGLVSRVADEQDRRRLLLTITPAGEQLLQNLLPVMLHSVRDSFHDFSPADLDRLLDSLKQLARVIDEASVRLSTGAQPETSA